MEAQENKLGIIKSFKYFIACGQALLLGQAKRASRERRSLRRSLARLVSLAQIGELARRLNISQNEILRMTILPVFSQIL